MIHPVSPGGPPSRPHAPRVPNKPTSRPPKAPANVTLDARGSAGAARRFVAKSNRTEPRLGLGFASDPTLYVAGRRSAWPRPCVRHYPFGHDAVQLDQEGVV